MVHYDVWNAAYCDVKKSLLLYDRKILNVKLYGYLYFMQLKTRSCFYFSIFCCQNFLLSVLHIYTFFGAVVELCEVMLGIVRKAC